MTFWDFSDTVVARLKDHVDLPGPWPFGVFGKDPTEALIQFGEAHAVMSVEEPELLAARITVRRPKKQDLHFKIVMTCDEARDLGDKIGELFRETR